jgi:hypothetical protein
MFMTFDIIIAHSLLCRFKGFFSFCSSMRMTFTHSFVFNSDTAMLTIEYPLYPVQCTENYALLKLRSFDVVMIK